MPAVSAVPTICKYGIEMPKGVNVLEAELLAYRKGGELGPAEHFRRAATILWGPDNPQKQFIWHPWADEMLEACCANQWVALSGSASCGKCLAPWVPVMLYSGGTKPAGQITQQDLLVGDKGEPRRVITTNVGRSPMVRIVPDKGQPWECNTDHILTLVRSWAGKKSKKRVGDVIDISVEDYLKKSTSFKRQHRLFSSGVEWPEKPTPVDPRVYGIWLGDGSTNRPRITSSDAEVEVNQYLEAAMSSAGYKVTRARYSARCPEWAFRMEGARENPFLTLVRESSGMSEPGKGGSKRIVPLYLHNSRRVRLELLAGLIDSDGHCRGTNYEINSSYPGLAADIKQLAISLGFRVTEFQGPHGNTRMTLLGDFQDLKPLRKKCRDTRRGRYPAATSFTVEPLGEGNWAGFTLDGNGRFLLGDGTVTHNTDFSAVWGIVNFLARPRGTQVICLSTTIEQSRKRIWGALQSYWTNARHRLPGKVLGKTIRPWDGSSTKLPDDRGITLFAAEKKKEREAAAQLIGIKAPRVLVLADELPELSEAVLEASITNLSTNPFFHFIGMGNHKSIHDAFGKFSKPRKGWGSVTVDDERWETDLGVTLHFDAMKHPNWIAQENIYPGVRFEKVQQAIDSPALGPNSPGFWRMFRSFPCPTGEEHVLYSEADFIKFQVEETPIWQGQVTKLAALDPAFTNGGDRAVLHYGTLGIAKDGVLTLCYGGYDELNEDVTKKNIPRDFQIVHQFRDRCIARGITPRGAALDATGAGSVLASIAHREWSEEVLRVEFGGAASDRPVGSNPSQPAKEKYVNRVSELWGVGVEFLHSGQLRGMSSALQAELSARLYTLVKGTTMRILVESKRDMKMRTGKSPDIADSAMILIELARQRFSFGTEIRATQNRPQDWVKAMKRMDVASFGNRNRLLGSRNL